MIRINVEITVPEQNRAKVLDNILHLAEKSRQEAGCIGYEIFEKQHPTAIAAYSRNMGKPAGPGRARKDRTFHDSRSHNSRELRENGNQ